MKIIETKKVTIPGYEGSQVVLYKKANWGSFAHLKQDSELAEQIVTILPRMVVSWNFQDTDGKDLPISAESMELLPADIVSFLLSECVPQTGTLKKKTSGE